MLGFYFLFLNASAHDFFIFRILFWPHFVSIVEEEKRTEERSYLGMDGFIVAAVLSYPPLSLYSYDLYLD